jgi:hypothetical protein
MTSFSELELKFSACHENEFQYLVNLHRETKNEQEKQERRHY